MSKYRRNIVLEYIQLGFRSFNVTNVIWLIYLALKGFTALEIGVFEALFHISSLSFEVPSGMIADLIGRKRSRIIGILLYLLYVLLMVFTTNGFLIGLAFIICGASYAFESGSGEALIYDSLLKTGNEEKYTKITGNREIIFQLSGGIALLVGGYLAKIDYNFNFLVVFIAFVTALIPIFMMTETQANLAKKQEKFSHLLYDHFIKSSKTVLANKNLGFLIILGALLAAPVTTIFFYFQLHLNETLLLDEIAIGSILATHGFAGMLAGLLTHKIEEIFKEKLLLYIVPLFLVLSFWLILLDNIINVPIIIDSLSINLVISISIPFLLLGFLDTLVYIVFLDYSNRIIPSDQRATILSFSSLSFSIVMIILFPTVGAIAEFWSFDIAFIGLASFMTVLYLALIIVLKTNNFTIKEK